MVAGDTRRIEGQQEDWQRVHRIHDAAFRTIVPSRYSNPAMFFERTVDVHCPVTPTSWAFRVTFARHFLGDVYCVIALRRTDNRPALVDVTFSVIVIDTYIREEDYSVKFAVIDMPPGRAERRGFPQFILLESAVQLFRYPQEVHFFLEVFDCHR